MYFRYIRDVQELRELRELQDVQRFREFRYIRYLQELIESPSFQPFQPFQEFQEFLDNKEIAIIICNTLTQRNSNNVIALLFALYNLILANKQIIIELQKPVEQALQQFTSLVSQQSTLVREQEQLLIKAIRQRLYPDALTQPTAQSVNTKMPEIRARELDTLKQRSQLGKEDMGELLDACGDTRKISAKTWQDLTQKEGEDGSVGGIAWLQLSHPFQLSSEAWTTLSEALKRPEPLFCGAATQVFLASKDVPEGMRRQGMQIILDILHEKTLSHRSLDIPNGGFLHLDNALFQTLQTLAEQDEKEA